MMPLDRFGKFVVKHLRDEPLELFERLVAGEFKASAFERLERDLGNLDEQTLSIVREGVKAVLSNMLHDFLFAVAEANDRIRELAITVDGVNVAAASDGLQGELYGERGWIARFNKRPG